jgi:hypothetical protein
MVTYNLEVLNPTEKTIKTLENNLAKSIDQIQPFNKISFKTLLHITGTTNLKLLAEKQKINYWNMLYNRNDTIGKTIKIWIDEENNPLNIEMNKTLDKIKWDDWLERNNKNFDNPIFWNEKTCKEIIRNHINLINNKENIEYFNISLINGTRQTEYILKYEIPFVANKGLKLPEDLDHLGWDWISHITGLDPWTTYDHRTEKTCIWCKEKNRELGKHIITSCEFWDIARIQHFENLLIKITANFPNYDNLEEYEILLENISCIQNSIKIKWSNDPYNIKRDKNREKFHQIILGCQTIFNKKGLINMNRIQYEIAESCLRWLEIVNRHHKRNTSPASFKKEKFFKINLDNLPHNFIRGKGKKENYDFNTKQVIKRNIEDFNDFV